MTCPECGSELEEDSSNDGAIVETDVCHNDFRCTNEYECGKLFSIEYHAVDITEVC